MPEYKSIFDGVEATLLEVGSRRLPKEQIVQYLDTFKHLEGKLYNDEEYYRILVGIVFYSGFKAQTVTAKLPVIHQHFPSYQKVATYGDVESQAIMRDTRMIRHAGKIRWCIDNARMFLAIINRYGSFQRYIDSFEPRRTPENLFRLKNDLQKLRGLSKITVYHFMTDIGMPVVKPDRVVTRIFSRLGLLEIDSKPDTVVRVGSNFARATGHPARYIDIVFASYGHEQHLEVGLERGICLEKDPACHLCGVTRFCKYYSGAVHPA